VSPEVGLRWLLEWLFRGGTSAADRCSPSGPGIGQCPGPQGQDSGALDRAWVTTTCPQTGGTTTTSIHRGQVTVLAQAPCYICVLHAIAGPGQALPAGPITHSHMCGSGPPIAAEQRVPSRLIAARRRHSRDCE